MTAPSGGRRRFLIEWGHGMAGNDVNGSIPGSSQGAFHELYLPRGLGYHPSGRDSATSPDEINAKTDVRSRDPADGPSHGLLSGPTTPSPVGKE